MNGTWHDELESAASVDEAVAAVKRYLGAVPAGELGNFSRYCHPMRIKGDADVDDLTFRLAQVWHEPGPAACNAAVLNEVFDIVLHASLRIAHLNRVRASGMTLYMPRRQMAQMG